MLVSSHPSCVDRGPVAKKACLQPCPLDWANVAAPFLALFAPDWTPGWHTVLAYPLVCWGHWWASLLCSPLWGCTCWYGLVRVEVVLCSPPVSHLGAALYLAPGAYLWGRLLVAHICTLFDRDTEQHKHPVLDLSFSQAECRADGGGGPPAAALGWCAQTCLFTAAVLPLVHAICFFTPFPSVRMTWRMQRPGFLQLAIQEPRYAEQCNVEANCLQSCCPF